MVARERMLCGAWCKESQLGWRALLHKLEWKGCSPADFMSILFRHKALKKMVKDWRAKVDGGTGGAQLDAGMVDCLVKLANSPDLDALHLFVARGGQLRGLCLALLRKGGRRWNPWWRTCSVASL